MEDHWKPRKHEWKIDCLLRFRFAKYSEQKLNDKSESNSLSNWHVHHQVRKKTDLQKPVLGIDFGAEFGLACDADLGIGKLQNTIWKHRNQTRKLQNSALGPPISSPEPSKTPDQSQKYHQITSKQARTNCGMHFRPTWLQIGGPRPSKMKAEILKNRCWKSTYFQHWFFKGSDVVLEGFLVGFSKPKRMPKVKSWF